MAINHPASLDSLTIRLVRIIKIQSPRPTARQRKRRYWGLWKLKVWVDNSAVATSLDYLVKSSSKHKSMTPNTLFDRSLKSGAKVWQFAQWNGSAWIPTPAGAWDILWPKVSVDSQKSCYGMERLELPQKSDMEQDSQR